MYKQLASGNFCDEHGKAQGFVIYEEYSGHMGFVDKGDRMDISYSICWRMEVDKKFVFTCWT
jgi:hypothetical protein